MESTETQIINFEKVCRLCLREKHILTEIFDADMNESSYWPIDQKIKACASIELYEGDGLPNRICVHCLSSVNAAFSFRLQCENADKTLHNVKRILVANDVLSRDDNGDNINKSSTEIHDPVVLVKKGHCEETEEGERRVEILCEVINSKVRNQVPVCQREDREKCSIIKCLEPSIVGCQTDASGGESLLSREPNANAGLGRERSNLEALDVGKCGEGARKAPCPYCNKRLTRIDEHIRLLHRNRVYKCLKQGCGAEFLTLKNLQSHQFNCYSLKKAYKCGKCLKEFHRKSNFKAHIRRHGNKKDFQCQFCDKAFVDSTGLKRHFLKHHEPEQEVFISGCCGKRFKSKEGLKKHVQKSICGIQVFQLIPGD